MSHEFQQETVRKGVRGRQVLLPASENSPKTGKSTFFGCKLSVLRMLMNSARLSTAKKTTDESKPSTSETQVSSTSAYANFTAPVTRSSQQKRKIEQYTTPSAKIIRRTDPSDDGGNYRRRPKSMVKLKEEDTEEERLCPILEEIRFANGLNLWELMCETDNKYKRSSDPFRHHPALGPQMRSILIDWLMDVCEAYNLHRETLYLAIDYLDRYLSVEENLKKDHLQLIGISCLFIAAKVEEIYPPKLATFAYVTDGACAEADIIESELLIMKTLKWHLSPVTPCNWVNIYLQILGYSKNIHKQSSSPSGIRTSPRTLLRPINNDMRSAFEGEPFLLTQYSAPDFVRACRLLDLAALDTKFLAFKYSILAAAAIFHTKGKEASVNSSKYSWETIASCVHWMAPFAKVTKRADVPDILPSIPNVSDTNRHLIQTYCVNLSMLERVTEMQNSSKILSPLVTDGLLTPPRSSEKYIRQSQKRFA